MKKEECRDFFELADKSHICKFNEGKKHCLCDNMVKFGECPKGIKEDEIMDTINESECYGDNCRGCHYYDQCGYIRISDPFHDQKEELS